MAKSIILMILTIILIYNNNCYANKISWDKLINTTKIWSQSFSTIQLKNFQSISDSLDLSERCVNSIISTLKASENLNDWSIEMINSWGKFPPSGVFEGTSTDFGAYDQCLNIEPNNIIGSPQYCTIDLSPPIPKPMPIHHNLFHRIDVLPEELKFNNNNSTNIFQEYSEFASFYYWISLRTGICTPSECSKSDITLLAKSFALYSGLEFRKVNCETKQLIRLSLIQIIAIVFALGFVLISLLATIVEKYLGQKSLFVKTFSLKQNINYLFANRSSEVFPCIHGIRVLTLVWVVFSHSTEWSNFQLFSRSFRVKKLFTTIQNQLLLNGEYSVENFFFIGGMLTSFISLEFTKGQINRFSTTGFLLSRFLRLTPQLFIFILLTFLLPLLSSGPLWAETITPIIDNCVNNWWRNLFYIQNMYKASEICALHSWYLASDMQYHWISLLLVIPLIYNVRLGTVCTLIIIIAFYVISTIISYLYDLPPGLINTGRDSYFIDYYIDLFYIKPWSHGSVFFVGFLFGIIAYNKKFMKVKQITKISIYLLIIFGYGLSLMDTYYWNSGEVHNRTVSALVFSTCRIVWALSTASLTWICISGNGGIVNRFLSSKLFIPLSRLTYSVYLTHVWIIWLYFGSRRENIDTNSSEIIYIFLHNLIIAYFIGFLFYMIFEIPILKLQKCILNYFVDDRIRPNDVNDNQLNELTIK